MAKKQIAASANVPSFRKVPLWERIIVRKVFGDRRKVNAGERKQPQDGSNRGRPQTRGLAILA